jgi:hypothetical protein
MEKKKSEGITTYKNQQGFKVYSYTVGSIEEDFIKYLLKGIEEDIVDTLRRLSPEEKRNLQKIQVSMPSLGSAGKSHIYIRPEFSRDRIL